MIAKIGSYIVYFFAFLKKEILALKNLWIESLHKLKYNTIINT